MRAIIIDDADCQALVDKLKLEAMQLDPTMVQWLQRHGWRSHG
jgi:hypothetical protein